jgi:hypothetical protein
MSGYDDNNGWGDDTGHGYNNSSLRKEDIENLSDRTDIDDEEKKRRKRKLEEEIAAGVVGGGILGYAGYHHHESEMAAIPPSRPASAASVSSIPSSVTTARTTGSLAYVAPALRAQRNTLRVQDEINRLLAEAARLQARNQLDSTVLDNDLHTATSAASKHLGPVMPTYTLPYCMDKASLAYTCQQFPRTTFKCSTDVQHDHPIAHTENMIATQHALRRTPAGSMIFDIWGSPKDVVPFRRSQGRADAPKQMIAYVETKTARDYLRKLNWPRADDGSGTPVFMEGTGDMCGDLFGQGTVLEEVDFGRPLVYFFRQSVYYMPDYDLANLLRVPGSRAIAVIHRHANASGSMFNGEISYAKKAGCVEQVNAITGERYYHRDISYLFDSKSKTVHTKAGSFAWTMHMVTRETWIIVYTGVPRSVEERIVRAERDGLLSTVSAEINEFDVAPSTFPHPALASLPDASCKMVGGIAVVSVLGGDLPPVNFTSPDLFEFLSKSVVGKPRDANRLADLFSLARSHVAGGSDYPGKMNFCCRSADIAGHVSLAFLSGLSSEIDLLRAVNCFHVSTREHSALLDGSAIVASGSVPFEGTSRAALSMMKRVNGARKQGDTLDGLISLFD